ncbi:hypothetical protein RFI_05804 [Reticulomyxa filosa]|uniref:Uncharacterized protein n=1 Tax=Reticulomyxa filosa TaxID=46433 RepID=X6NZC5_RETFI|nr:hypothetical protein RFI_05804 [Reticulomyxa filosa]|eukprot:ETO31316.1 hypothetical protein RFI_05804 [Reticulomyxa filosa]
MFTVFEMEIDYLSLVAWEGLKCGQAIISCEIQQRVLNTIKHKYPRKDIFIISQWSRINSFGFLQGQESVHSLLPINSTYFPHLTFQEWLAAYYLVNCLYESSESDNHQQVCAILINQQLTPKFAVMIPFMAGILYENIKKKRSIRLWFIIFLEAATLFTSTHSYSTIDITSALSGCLQSRYREFISPSSSPKVSQRDY